MGNSDFRRLWTANTVSSLGTWLLIIALPVHVYELTSSPLATSLALAIEAAPALLLGPWAGVFADRWDRRVVMAAASVASAGGVVLVLVGGLHFIYLGMLAESVAVVFLHPAGRALLPSIVGKGRELEKANSVNAFTHGTIRMTGPVLGMVAYVQGGLTLVVTIDIASYLAAAVLVMTIRPRRQVRTKASPVVLAELRAFAGPLLFTNWVFWTGNGALTALLVPFLVLRLGRDGADLGYLITALGAGHIAGAAICRPLLALPPRLTLAVAGTATGVCFLVMFNASTLAVAAAGAFAAGVPGVVVGTTIHHAIQSQVADGLLGRVGAALGMTDAAAAVTGAALAATVTPAFGIAVALNVFSAAVLLTGASAAAIPGRSIDRHAEPAR